MSWRIVYVTNADKLSLNLNSVQIIHEEQKYFVSLSEIAIIVIEDYKSIITVRLLIELAKQGIPILVLAMNSMPIGEYFPISNNVRTSKRIVEQILWTEENKKKLWTEIVKGKIKNQMNTLRKLDIKEKIPLLEKNIKSIQLGDKTNVEGISARIYFKELFGNEFIRFNETIENYCLNFSYHIVRTLISKEIVARGYNASLGIAHKNQYNVFNFADDLIEVFRPIVDYYVYLILSNNLKNQIYELDRELKIKLINIVNQKVIYKSKQFTIINVVPQYVNDIINFVTENKILGLEIPILLDE
jgi:CRISPR-associated protein Cas1